MPFITSKILIPRHFSSQQTLKNKDMDYFFSLLYYIERPGTIKFNNQAPAPGGKCPHSLATEDDFLQLDPTLENFSRPCCLDVNRPSYDDPTILVKDKARVECLFIHIRNTIKRCISLEGSSRKIWSIYCCVCSKSM